MNRWEKKLVDNYTRVLRAVLNASWMQHSNKTAVVWPTTSHLINHSSKTRRHAGTAGEVRTQTHGCASVDRPEKTLSLCMSCQSPLYIYGY